MVALDTPHHVTQRGNARQVVFLSDADRRVYLSLLGKACRHYHLSLIGSCLLSNHVHLMVVPKFGESLPFAIKYVHGR